MRYRFSLAIVILSCATPPSRSVVPREAEPPSRSVVPREAEKKSEASASQPSSVHARPVPTKSSTTTSTAYVLVASEHNDHKVAIKAAKRLSSRERLPLADTLREPPTELHLVGKVVSLHRPKPGQFVVTAFMGLESSVAGELRERIRQHAPSAHIVQRRIANFDQLPTYDAYSLSRVVILASVRRCDEAMRTARRIARRTRVAFSSRGLTCDPKRGLIWPDNFADDILAGAYFGRRYNDCGTRKLTDCISVERADFYGFRTGYHIVVGGIYGDREARRALALYRTAVPSAYAKDATIYLGCIH